MRVAWLDCSSGVAGDMFAAAFLDAGLPLEELARALGDLGLPGWSLETRRVRRQGLAATHLDVRVDEGRAPRFHHFEELLAAAERARPDLPDPVRERGIEIVRRIGRAEAEVHGLPLREVHLHTLGAVDTLVDAMAAAAVLHLSGIERLVASELGLGGGTATIPGHGTLRSPSPATAALLRGAPIRGIAAPIETVTPTGAAILAVLADAWGELPPMRLESVGVGAGAADPPGGAPNCLRAMVGEALEAPGRASGIAPAAPLWAVECNLDDESGQVLGHMVESLLAAGAADAWLTAATMKKGRPGVLLCALADDARLAAIETIILRETRTLGLRRWRVERSVLERWQEETATPWGRVRIKVRALPGGGVAGSPEYEDCRKLAQDAGVALREVLDQAEASWRSSRQSLTHFEANPAAQES